MDVWKQHGDTVPEKQCGCIELHGNNVEVQSTTEIMEGIPPMQTMPRYRAPHNVKAM